MNLERLENATSLVGRVTQPQGDNSSLCFDMLENAFIKYDSNSMDWYIQKVTCWLLSKEN